MLFVENPLVRQGVVRFFVLFCPIEGLSLSCVFFLHDRDTHFSQPFTSPDSSWLAVKV